ncbi:hypothetical protein SDRG_09231 [Saprolegnia diclina VS20]|uniref:Uncharacterized protein n=1 Tax=Saprolegnia diclina (strain VS20) TaxID=1156394 RepID=T0RLQ6_SAPDV|nr:hypothetical protein SDRG_09231 [Saprolegnia diclina VS20]EQC33248.1 hypothetical protein SDRG_09231 [Saprolegnia diclina VS20]|eukprot:XP_008613371.1 hypothetical protein SDRG_09231 [Saprolegnia diclina VS20]
MAQRQPTRPAGGRKLATSIKATRDLLGMEKLPRISSPRESPGDQLMANPPPEADDGDDEAQRVQGYDLQYCESMLVAIEKESTQNSQRYLNMLEFKEGKDPKLESMRASFKSLTDELRELEVLCASGWDTDDIDEALRRLPRDVVAIEAHRWASS